MATLLDADWAGEWRALEQLRGGSDNSEYWDKRAKSFPTMGEHSSYVDEFLRLADVAPGESVLDMGCGTGALAIPLAAAGCRVVAADFSQGMLDMLNRDLAALGLASGKSVDVKLMSWEDDWEACGVGPKSVDVALASRSMATPGIAGALERLSRTARKRVCVTLPTERSPRIDGGILSKVGIVGHARGSHLYAFVILHQMGFRPEVRYIRSERVDTFSSRDDAVDYFETMAKRALDMGGLLDRSWEDAMRALEAWVDVNLVENPDEGKPGDKRELQKAFRLKEPRIIEWAFLSWEV